MALDEDPRLQAVGIDVAELEVNAYASYTYSHLGDLACQAVWFLGALIFWKYDRQISALICGTVRSLSSPRRRWNLCCRRHPSDDREILLEQLSQSLWLLDATTETDHKEAFRDAAVELRADREVVMTAVRRHGWLLQHAAEELRGDHEIVMKAVAERGSALQFATEEQRSDREIVMTAVSERGCSLEYATEELRGDREIVMKAVSNNTYALQYATEELRGDRNMVMTAVSHCGYALNHAAEELRGDPEVMKVALKEVARQYGSAVVALKVTLLSGLRCTQIFSNEGNLLTVLRRCARLLDLDSDHVGATGTFLQGTHVIKSLKMLEIGKEHELTLVLS